MEKKKKVLRGLIFFCTSEEERATPTELGLGV